MLLVRNLEASPSWVARHRAPAWSASGRPTGAPAAHGLAFAPGRSPLADLPAAAAAVAASALCWLFLLGAVAAPLARLLPG